MPFTTEDMVEYQERENEARKASQLPAGYYVFEITASDISDSNGLPRLRLTHVVKDSEDGKNINRYHSTFMGWYASETSDSPKPFEERQRTIRSMNGALLQKYMVALTDSPTSDQELGESLNDCSAGLSSADDVGTVGDYLETIGNMLKGQEIVAEIAHKGSYVNLLPLNYDLNLVNVEAIAV